MEHGTHKPSVFATTLGVTASLAALPALADERGLGGLLEAELVGASPIALEAWLTKLVCLLTGIFIASFSRAQFDLRQRLGALDHALWLATLLCGTAIGGVIAIFGVQHQGGLLVGMLSILLAMSLTAAAVRHHCRLPAVRIRFLLAATAALLGPAWVVLQTNGAMLSMTPAALTTIVATLSLMLLSIPFSGMGAEARSESAIGPSMQSPEESRRTRANLAPGALQPEPVAAASPGKADRRELHQRLVAGMKRTRRGNTQLALIWVKLEGLEEARGMLGDDIAEALARGVELRLNQTVGSGMLVCKHSVSTFALVFEAVSSMEEVVAWIDDIRAALAPPVDIGDGAIAVDTGVGHALYPQDGDDPASLYRAAARRASRTTRTEQRLKSVA